jgi:pre-mRNA-splicing factor 18
MDLMAAAMRDSKRNLASTVLWKKGKDKEGEEEEEIVVPKKYMRRGEIAQIAREKVERVEERERVLRKETEKALPAAASSINDLKMEEADEEDSMDASEVKWRLRSYAQPLTFFGESDRERLQRLKHHELLLSEKQGGSMGTGHELQAIIAAEVDSEIVNATLAAMEHNNAEDPEESRKAAAKQERVKERRHNKYKEMRTRDEFDNPEDFIVFFFKRMLLVWEEELAARPSDEKASTKGKQASGTQKQTRQYLHPFFKQLKSGECPKDVVKCTEVIVSRCIEREYVKASESYLKMAIGNAAWPMGVTMVGIHERAGREKIHTSNVAHCMNNEMSRKYIQGIKRIMTFCQHAYPTFPSKMVV